METKKELKKKVEAAWKEWQSEESRDRGWNYDRVKKLERNYRGLKERLEELE